MSDPRSIKASYHSFRPILSRKVLQLHFEVSLENQNEVLAFLGPPNFETSQWFTITPYIPEDQRKHEPSTDGAELVKQCAIACADERFQAWMANGGWISVVDEATAAEAIRKVLGVKSRKEIGTNEIVGQKWKHVWETYRNDMATEDYGGMMR